MQARRHTRSPQHRTLCTCAAATRCSLPGRGTGGHAATLLPLSCAPHSRRSSSGASPRSGDSPSQAHPVRTGMDTQGALQAGRVTPAPHMRAGVAPAAPRPQARTRPWRAPRPSSFPLAHATRPGAARGPAPAGRGQGNLPRSPLAQPHPVHTRPGQAWWPRQLRLASLRQARRRRPWVGPRGLKAQRAPPPPPAGEAAGVAEAAGSLLAAAAATPAAAPAAATATAGRQGRPPGALLPTQAPSCWVQLPKCALPVRPCQVRLRAAPCPIAQAGTHGTATADRASAQTYLKDVHAFCSAASGGVPGAPPCATAPGMQRLSSHHGQAVQRVHAISSWPALSAASAARNKPVTHHGRGRAPAGARAAMRGAARRGGGSTGMAAWMARRTAGGAADASSSACSAGRPGKAPTSRSLSCRAHCGARLAAETLT